MGLRREATGMEGRRRNDTVVPDIDDGVAGLCGARFRENHL